MKQPSSEFTIQQAFRESWELFTKKVGSLLAITSLTFLAQFALFILTIGVVASLVLGAGHVDLINFRIDMLGAIPGWVVLSTIVSVLVSFVASTVVSFVGLISMYLSVASKDSSLRSYAKSSLGTIAPLFLTQFLVYFLVLGNFFAFIIPALVAGFFCMFVTQVVIYEHKSTGAAIRRSISLVSQNFGSLFVKLAVPFLIQAIIEGIFNSMVKQNPSVGMMFALPHIVFSVAWGYYMFVYSYILYKRTAATTTNKTSSILTWLTVGSVIGALILAALIYGGIALLRNPKTQRAFQEMAAAAKEQRAKDATASATLED